MPINVIVSFFSRLVFLSPHIYGNSPIGILEIENNVIKVELAHLKSMRVNAPQIFGKI